MNKLILKLYDFLACHKWVCGSTFVVVTVLLIVQFLSLNYKEDISDFIPLDKNRQEALKIYQEISGANKIIAIFQHSDTSSVDPDVLVQAIDGFVETLQESDSTRLVYDLMYQIDTEKIAEITDFVYGNIPYFITAEDYTKIDSVLSQPDYISDRLKQNKQLLMLPSGGFLAENIQRDPLNIFTPIVSRLNQSHTNSVFESYDGYIFTPDMKKAIVMVTSPFGSSETENNAGLLELLSVSREKSESENPMVDILLTGGPVIAVGNASQIKTDSVVSVLIAVVLILALLFYCFRNFRNILLISVSIAWGWLFAIAGLAILHDKISIIVVGISSVILGIAVNYPLHLIAHLSHVRTVRDALREIITPLLIGNITTVGAFCTLIPLQSVALSDLGMFSSFLLIGTILFVIVYLPHVLKPTSAQHTQAKAENNDIFTRIGNFLLPDTKVTIIGIIIITAVLGYFSRFTTFDSNMSNINYMDNEQRANMAYFQKFTQGTSPDEQCVYVVSTDTTLDNALQKSAMIQHSLKGVVSSDSTMRYASCSQFITSSAVQRERIAQWNSFVNKYRTLLTTELQRQMAIAGFAEDSFDDFFDIVDRDYPPVIESGMGVLAPVFSTNLSCDSLNSRYSVVDIITTQKYKTANVEESVESLCKEQYCFDIQSLNNTIAINLSDNFGYIGWACGVIVFLFLWITFGRLEIALMAFLPMAISWVWILGLMGLFGIQFNIVNVILATFIFGQGDDYTIFMTEGCIYEYTHRKKILNSYKSSIIVSALIMFIGIGSLIFAKHPALYSLAQVTIVGMFSVVLMAYLVPPIVFRWMVMSNGKYRKRPLTLASLGRTWFCGIWWICQLITAYLLCVVLYLCGRKHLSSKSILHRYVSWSHRLDLKLMPGVKYHLENRSGETFEKPGIIVCNHQSMLDPMCLMALTPKVLIVANEHSSLNPVVRLMFKWLNFYTIKSSNFNAWKDSSLERDMDLFRTYINNGYNIAIFPEGKRNVESSILRHHKGPFYLAKELGVDIIPVFIHGMNGIMPMSSFASQAGRLTVEIHKRITPDSRLWDDDYSVMTRNIHKYYIKEYAELAQRIENADYFAPLVIERYLYKEADVYKTVKNHMKANKNYTSVVDVKYGDDVVVVISGCGYGELPLLFSLVHPGVRVIAIDSDSVKLDVAKHSAEGVSGNITFANNLDEVDCNGENYTYININHSGGVVL